ncbi:MAG: hypothetical protein AB7K36_24210, partial [Chloroflexota bacterium]
MPSFRLRPIVAVLLTLLLVTYPQDASPIPEPGSGTAYAETQCPVGQYRAEYFANDSLSGSPAVVRCESKIDYRWGHSAPVSGIGADNF